MIELESIIDEKVNEISPLFHFFEDLKENCKNVLERKPTMSRPSEIKKDGILMFTYRKHFSGTYSGKNIECNYFSLIEPFKYKIFDSRVYIKTSNKENLYIRMGDYGNRIIVDSLPPVKSSIGHSILKLYLSHLENIR